MQPDSSPSNDQNYPDDHQPLPLPKVGQTRCYWALLNSTLDFIYLDPVLANHLEEQADLLIGKSLIQFVHPDEQASAKQDLGSVVDSKTMHGSITRVRFSRLTRFRRLLGHDGPPPPWSESEKIAIDANYMAVDIVTNWAADGLVLCFIHATVDLTPSDNDEQKKTGWTNWCGTYMMDVEQIERLYRSLLMFIPPSSMSRVFQILSNSPDRPLLLSWPPEPSVQGQGPSGRDFAKLVETVEFGTNPSLNDAKTSCTRRYRSMRGMPYFADAVESIFIPHGSVIFACHKVNASPRNSATAIPPTYNTSTYGLQQQYYEQHPNFVLPPLSSAHQGAYNGNYMPQQTQSVPSASYPPHRWSTGVPETPNMYNQWDSPVHTTSSLPSTVSNLRSGTYPPHLQQWQTPPAYMQTTSEPQQGYRPVSPTYSYPPVTGNGVAPQSPQDVVPPPRRRVSPGSTRDLYPTTSRAASNRPMGILRCSSCKATQSPEWRKGPSGKKELCNACGLRYARSRAKKEGHPPAQRRRKDKAQTKRDSASPPTATSSYQNARRRTGEESSFSTSPAGSASGSDVFPQTAHPTLPTLTPSPSPPATNMNFVHYSPGANGRQQYSTNTTAFYSVPSPLSNQPVLNPSNDTSQQPQSHNNQLPPLGQISTYASRLSPMLPSASPVAHSPLTSTLPPASYERERDRDRELPPTPLSAEPRHSRRSILTHQ
ncbi:hypothetical protein AMATHDRAFT_73596 [Amanita thiersii Skay4041]|uniref:GATA-type domain-containing protein n=1 Tax=Amanita thiersii Skay4041 TaxID=703135 RepID=A0A2A9NYM0_9AGAR|nr:hypothetical protein AMATHDRAFT_73596 [Amanita thiersii Skay4041]